MDCFSDGLTYIIPSINLFDGFSFGLNGYEARVFWNIREVEDTDGCIEALHKEYGEDFEKTIKYLKEELRPCVKEFMLAIDDATAAIQKTIYDAEDRERIHDEKVAEEREAAKEKKSE